MDPDKPVTKDLIARGFGRDVMGLLLAYREADLERMFRPMKIGHVLRMINFVECIVPCESCDAVSFDISERTLCDSVYQCPWCKVARCVECDPNAVYARPCDKCAIEWCPECGSDTCLREDICYDCESKICANTTCSRCWIAYRQVSTNPRYVTLAEMEPRDQENIKAVATRLGVNLLDIANK